MSKRFIKAKDEKGKPTMVKSTPQGNSYWYICTRSHSKALELVLKTILPHVYLESETKTPLGYKTFNEVMQPYWATLQTGKCPFIQDLPGFVQTSEFAEGFGIEVPNTQSFYYRHVFGGNGLSVPGIEDAPGILDQASNTLIYQNTVVAPADTGYLSSTINGINSCIKQPVADYSIPKPGADLFGNSPGLYSDNGTGWYSIGWKGAPNEEVFKKQFAGEGYSAENSTFKENNWKINLHAQAYYHTSGSFADFGNAYPLDITQNITNSQGNNVDVVVDNPFTTSQFEELSAFANPALLLSGTNSTFVNSTGYGNVDLGLVNYQQLLDVIVGNGHTGYVDSCTGDNIFNLTSLINPSVGMSDLGKASHIGRDFFNMSYTMTIKDESLRIEDFVDGILKVKVPSSWHAYEVGTNVNQLGGLFNEDMFDQQFLNNSITQTFKPVRFQNYPGVTSYDNITSNVQARNYANLWNYGINCNIEEDPHAPGVAGTNGTGNIVGKIYIDGWNADNGSAPNNEIIMNAQLVPSAATDSGAFHISSGNVDIADQSYWGYHYTHQDARNQCGPCVYGPKPVKFRKSKYVK